MKQIKNKTIRNKIVLGLFLLIIIVIISWLAVGYLKQNINQQNLIGKEVVLRRVMLQGNKTQHAYVAIPYTSDSQEYSIINVAIDLNKDGKIEPYSIGEQEQQEWVIQNMSPRIYQKLGNNFSFNLSDEDVEERNDFSVKIILTNKEINNWDGEALNSADYQTVVIPAIEQDEVRPRFTPDPEGIRSGGLPDLLINNVWAQDKDNIPDFLPENYISDVKESGGDKLKINKATAVNKEKDENLTGGSMGPGVPTGKTKDKEIKPIKSDAEQFDVFHYPVPDITQRPNECVPTSVANSLIWLAQKYNFKEKLPKTERELIDELKVDFLFSRYGVDVPNDFLDGKNAIITRRKLPLETHQVGEVYDAKILAKIAEELRKGQDVEVDLEYVAYKADGHLHRVGGHMVTVVGARKYKYKNKAYLEIHDPLSPGPRKLDIYRLKGTRLINYRYGGAALTYIRFAIAESPMLTPETPEKTATSTPREEPVPPPTSPKVEPITPEGGSRGETIGLSVQPNSLSFQHQIGTTICPTPIGKVKLTTSDKADWKIVSNLPKWLGVNTKAGTGSQDVIFNFTCQLDDYISQELYNEVKFQQVDQTGTPINSIKMVTIQGNIKK